jgi:ATP-dependent RNA helicase RhlE
LHLLSELEGSVLVFGRTKHGCDKVVRILSKKWVNAAAIHGNKSQSARQKALKGFKEGNIRVLVATDIAARGIDISGLEHVVNYDLPNVPETYVHRIGRTGRADASGSSISFCNAEERAYLKDIEKLIKAEVPLITDHPFTEGAEEEWADPENRTPKKKQQRPPRKKREGQNASKGQGGGSPKGVSNSPSRRKGRASRRS